MKKYKTGYILVGGERFDVEDIKVYEESDPYIIHPKRSFLPFFRFSKEKCYTQCPCFGSIERVNGIYSGYCTLFNRIYSGYCVSAWWRAFYIHKLNRKLLK